MQDKPNKISIPSALLTILIAIAVIIGAIAGLTIIGVAAWAFVLTVFWFATVENMNPNKYLSMVVGGLLGVTLGFGLSLANLLGAYTIVGIIIYAIITLFFATCQVRGDLPVAANPFTWINTIVLPMIPGVSTLSNSAGPFGNIISVYSGYIIAFIVLGIITLLIGQSSEKKANPQAKSLSK